MEQKVSAMFGELTHIDEMEWGNYAFSQDFLRGKVDIENQQDMISKAIACGEAYAKQIWDTYKTRNPKVIAEKLKIDIAYKDEPMGDKRVLYAQFIPENKIEIMLHPQQVYKELLTTLDDKEVKDLPKIEEIEKTIIAHEIFHFLEEQNETTIYTRVNKIKLWKVWKFEQKSTIRAVGEIAAMSFAKTIVGAKYSPFTLDFLLFYGYNINIAIDKYKFMIQFKEEGNKQNDTK